MGAPSRVHPQAPTPASARVRPADRHPVAVYLAGGVGHSPRTPRLALSIAAPLLSSGCMTRRRDKRAIRTQEQEAQIERMNGEESQVTEQSSTFETTLDPYETRALALRTTVLKRIREEGAPDDPLLLRIISALGRVPASEGDRVAVVVADVMVGVQHSPQERQQTYVSVAGVAQAFDPEIQQFKEFFLEAAQQGAPRDTRAAWRAYLQGLIDLFEDGAKGPPGK